MIEAPTRAHSVKPEKIYRMIEDYFPNLPKLEMFARDARTGWYCWGAEAPDQNHAIILGSADATRLEIVVVNKMLALALGR